MADRSSQGRHGLIQMISRGQARGWKRRASVSHRLQPAVQYLEDRTLLSLGPVGDATHVPLRIEPMASQKIVPLEVVLINQDVPEAQAIAATAAPGVITLMYDPATTDTSGLVGTLGGLSALHGARRSTTSPW